MYLQHSHRLQRGVHLPDEKEPRDNSYDLISMGLQWAIPFDLIVDQGVICLEPIRMCPPPK